jgi:hypothetical protein
MASGWVGEMGTQRPAKPPDRQRQLGQQQANLAHLDETMRLFDPDIPENHSDM